MALKSRRVVEEVWSLRGRFGALPSSTRIAVLGHHIYCAGIKEILGPWWLDVGKTAWMKREAAKRELPMPEGAKFKFLGRDVTAKVAENWKAIAKDIVRGELIYNEIIALKPDAVIVWNDEYAPFRAACMAARELGIPSFEVCHGAFYLPKHGHWATKKYAAFQCGTRNYGDFHSRLGLEGTFVETGSVEIDPYVGVDGMTLRIAARTELQIPLDRPVVTFLTDAPFERTSWQDRGTTFWWADYFFRAFKALKATIPGVHLVVKVHPYEHSSAEEYDRILREDYGLKDDYAVVDDPLITAVAAADLIVGRASSAMAVGMACAVPSLIVANEPFIPREMIEGKGLMLAQTPGELFEKLLLFFVDPEMAKRLISETPKGLAYYGGDGNAARRIASRVIEELGGK